MEVFEMLSNDYTDKTQLKRWITKFFRLWAINQWKRERIAPSFHLDDFNVDPRTWCRFPILSSGFEEELIRLNQGTGSQPLPPQGWQLKIRLMASQPPFPTPCFMIASCAYVEHVGEYLQVAGSNGEMVYLQINTGNTKTFRMSCFTLQFTLVFGANNNYGFFALWYVQ